MAFRSLHQVHEGLEITKHDSSIADITGRISLPSPHNDARDDDSCIAYCKVQYEKPHLKWALGRPATQASLVDEVGCPRSMPKYAEDCPWFFDSRASTTRTCSVRGMTRDLGGQIKKAVTPSFRPIPPFLYSLKSQFCNNTLFYLHRRQYLTTFPTIRLARPYLAPARAHIVRPLSRPVGDVCR